jgi:hypothetical protein
VEEFGKDAASRVWFSVQPCRVYSGEDEENKALAREIGNFEKILVSWEQRYGIGPGLGGK